MEKQTQSTDWAATLAGHTTRREFLQRAAVGAAIVAIPSALSGCHVLGAVGKPKLDFGDDFGVLNYAYALETLEAKFYQRIVSSPPPDLKPGEFEILRDIGAAEPSHRQPQARQGDSVGGS